MKGKKPDYSHNHFDQPERISRKNPGPQRTKDLADRNTIHPAMKGIIPPCPK